MGKRRSFNRATKVLEGEAATLRALLTTVGDTVYRKECRVDDFSSVSRCPSTVVSTIKELASRKNGFAPRFRKLAFRAVLLTANMANSDGMEYRNARKRGQLPDRIFNLLRSLITLSAHDILGNDPRGLDIAREMATRALRTAAKV